MQNGPRILFLDIETRLLEAYTFGIRDQHITHKQLKNADDGRNLHCIGLKFSDEKRVTVLSEWEHGYKGMLERVHAALSEADAVATYNGARFDLPKIWGQFLIFGMKPPAEPTHIDIFKTTRKMGFPSSKLDYVAGVLGLGSKVKHDGLDMWIAVLNGDEKAQRKMARYCAGDVRLTEAVYDRIRGFVTNHPHMGLTAANACGTCGSLNTQQRGKRRTKSYIYDRHQCTDCGQWYSGRRYKVSHVLAAIQ